MRPVKRATRMRHSACALAIATLACAASLGPSAVHAANGNGPQTTLDVADGGGTTAKLADGAVTGTKINSMGATTGQFLKYFGGTWIPATSHEGTMSIR